MPEEKPSLFCIKEPQFPKNNDYTEITKYLLDSHFSAINYYRLVFLCGCIGLIFSLILLLVLLANHDWNLKLIFRIKEYPAIICSIITMAFGQIEMELKKKDLYNHLKETASNNIDNEDADKIVSDYKIWSWGEFQNIFKQ